MQPLNLIHKTISLNLRLLSRQAAFAAVKEHHNRECDYRKQHHLT